ncbi:hypothetical protein [Paenibacillus alvei]|nr:hypothetical protein [Paenibacillus alvei]MBG9736825.1 hypothetical protein [Paenibacillus alvei]MBG9746981.1 hypothetical protein [Paenibacillus alvei]MCY9582009.1 hypothetical protein [Paenibacillus alvei]MCY9585907.1 hypothetical protein [Paenibacillus alvei]NEZ43522.1 hypothetical protein [Paenibacillus alvei]
MIYALASDRDEASAAFFINAEYSGTSTAIPSPGFQACHVKSITIDSLMAGLPLAGQKLLFKIDVEGYEEKL